MQGQLAQELAMFTCKIDNEKQNKVINEKQTTRNYFHTYVS